MAKDLLEFAMQNDAGLDFGPPMFDDDNKTNEEYWNDDEGLSVVDEDWLTERDTICLIRRADNGVWTTTEEILIEALIGLFPGKQEIPGLGTIRIEGRGTGYCLDMIGFLHGLSAEERAYVLTRTTDKISDEMIKVLLAALEPEELTKLLRVLQDMDDSGKVMFEKLVARMSWIEYKRFLTAPNIDEILDSLTNMTGSPAGNA